MDLLITLRNSEIRVIMESYEIKLFFVVRRFWYDLIERICEICCEDRDFFGLDFVMAKINCYVS